MKKISLIVDETASLLKEITEKYEMVIVPYLIDWREGNELPGENIFQKMKEAERQGIQTLPKTSQPSPWTFKKIFEEEFKKSEKILCITLSSKISGGYNSACQGKGMLPKEEQKRIYIIDSLSATVGEGLFALKAAELIERGKNIEDYNPPTTQKKVRVAIGHADNSSAAQKLKEIITKELPEIEIAFTNLIDSIIGVHIGPGTLVCAWHEIE